MLSLTIRKYKYLSAKLYNLFPS